MVIRIIFFCVFWFYVWFVLEKIIFFGRLWGGGWGLFVFNFFEFVGLVRCYFEEDGSGWGC